MAKKQLPKHEKDSLPAMLDLPRDGKEYIVMLNEVINNDGGATASEIYDSLKEDKTLTKKEMFFIGLVLGKEVAERAAEKGPSLEALLEMMKPGEA